MEDANVVDIVAMRVVVLAPKTQNVHGAQLATYVWSKPHPKLAFPLLHVTSFLLYS